MRETNSDGIEQEVEGNKVTKSYKTSQRCSVLYDIILIYSKREIHARVLVRQQKHSWRNT